MPKNNAPVEAPAEVFKKEYTVESKTPETGETPVVGVDLAAPTGRTQSAEPNVANTPKDSPFANTTPPPPEMETRVFPRTIEDGFKNIPEVNKAEAKLRQSPESFNYDADKPKGDEITVGETVRYLGYLYRVIRREPGNVLAMMLAHGKSSEMYHALAHKVERLP